MVGVVVVLLLGATFVASDLFSIKKNVRSLYVPQKIIFLLFGSII